MLRCAILSEVAEFAPIGIGVSSNLISAIRHWCGAFVMTSLNDNSVPENGPSRLPDTGVSCEELLLRLVDVQPAAEERIHFHTGIDVDGVGVRRVLGLIVHVRRTREIDSGHGKARDRHVFRLAVLIVLHAEQRHLHAVQHAVRVEPIRRVRVELAVRRRRIEHAEEHADFDRLRAGRVALEAHPRDGEVEDEVAVVVLLQELERRTCSSCVRPDSKLSLPTAPPPDVRFAMTFAMNPGASAGLVVIVALKRSARLIRWDGHLEEPQVEAQPGAGIAPGPQD